MAVAHQRWGEADADVYRAALDLLRPSKSDLTVAMIAAVVSAVILIPWWLEAPARSAAIMIGATAALLFIVWDNRRLSLAQQLYIRVRAELGGDPSGGDFVRTLFRVVLNANAPFLFVPMAGACLFTVPWIGWPVAVFMSGFLIFMALAATTLGFLSPRFRVHFFIHLAAWSRPASRDAFLMRAAANDTGLPAGM